MTPAPSLFISQSATLSRAFSANDVAALLHLAGGDHGVAMDMLVTAMWSTLLGMHLPGPGTNYLKQATRFLAQAPLDAPLTARVQITQIRLEKGLVDLQCTCVGADGVLIAEGRALVQARDTGRLPQP